MKVISNLRSVLPKKFVVWDLHIVLGNLSNLEYDLRLKDLPEKLIFLCLLSGQRGQPVKVLNVKDMLLEKVKCTFFSKSSIKPTRPGFHQSPVVFSEYPSNSNIWIVTTITHYLEIRKELQMTDQLIISYKKADKAVTTSDISRWYKAILRKAGIDIVKYWSQSTRSVSTIKAQIKGLSLREINKVAGWNEKSTFRRFHDKPIFKSLGVLVI